MNMSVDLIGRHSHRHATFLAASERESHSTHRRSAGVFRDTSHYGICLLGFSREPAAGNRGGSIFLFAVDVAVRLHVSVPGNAGVGPDPRGSAAAHAFRTGNAGRAP